MGAIVSVFVLWMMAENWEKYWGTNEESRKFEKAKLVTNYGDIEIRFNENTPIAVNKFVERARSAYYVGTRFHRVVSGLLIEGGDPLSRSLADIAKWGSGGSGKLFVDEIVPENKMIKGAVAMANHGPNTNDTQFFIIAADDVPWLNGQHTIFGYVTSGIEVVEKISKISAGPTGVPNEEVKINKILLY